MSSSKALRTVSPPKPESNTPIVGWRACIAWTYPDDSSGEQFGPMTTIVRLTNYDGSRAVELETVAPANSELRPQHPPGGIGAPCGQVRGCPRKAQILSVASGERMCSNLQACCSISDSLSIARLSVKRR